MICPDLPPVRALRLIILCLVLLAFPAAAQARAWTSIFYYPWYGTPAHDGTWEHWLGPGGSALGIASNYYPARGLYSSSDRRVLAAQMREIASTGVGEVVYSWWGWGSPEDVRLPLVMRAANTTGLSVAVHLEPYSGRTVASVEGDIDHLRTLGISRFFVYQPFEIEAADWAGLRTRVPDVQLFAETALAGRAAAAQFDGIYTYDILRWGGDTFSRICKQAHQAGLLCLPSVGPGYEASRTTGDLRVKPRRDGATYDAMWKAAIRSHADEVTITSYNEWHEGTQIEPARARRPGTAAAAALQSYDGAYGLQGRASESAYLQRTAHWMAAFARARASGFGRIDPG
jgi:glycoprotein endo-alpha-1,2-mannosidase